MRLREETRPEDLEVVEYWAKENGRAWPVNEDNDPLDSNGNVFAKDDNGLPIIDQTIDPQEAEEYDSAPIMEAVELPELIVVKLRMLLGRDDDEITQAMIKIQTKQGRRNRRAEIETEIDHASAAALKLQKGIVEWSGIQDKDGNPAAITAENIGLLPAWIKTDLTDRITSMSMISDEDEGE